MDQPLLQDKNINHSLQVCLLSKRAQVIKELAYAKTPCTLWDKGPYDLLHATVMSDVVSLEREVKKPPANQTANKKANRGNIPNKKDGKGDSMEEWDFVGTPKKKRK